MSNDQLSTLFNIVGMTGTVSFLVAYFMLQKEKWKFDGAAYLGMNFFGALCLITSLLWHWNLASFLLECAWLTISGYGIIKALKKGRPTA